MTPIQLALQAAKKEQARRKAESSLIEFTKQAWHIIEPGTSFVDNWHLHAVADHLEAVSAGEIENLLINIPPGCMKSILVSVLWPAWEWIDNPGNRILGASYGEDLAVRDALKCRDIILSEWYQDNWPHVAIKRGEDQKTKYALIGGGWRMATSVGGRATGEHPDRKIVDDPHNAKQAQSDAERRSALEWFDQTLSTRGVSRGARTVVVMQRLHEKDVSGHILADLGDYEHLCLPMRYESKRNGVKTKLGWQDPRSVEGSLLWPELFPEEKIKKLERSLGDYGSAGQLQQRPSPPGGGILKTKHFQLWPSRNGMPQILYLLQSYDTAFTEKSDGDPTGCTVWGVFSHQGKRCCLLIDAWQDHLGYPQLRKQVISDWKATYGADPNNHQVKGRRPDNIIVEAKASGQSLIQDLNAANIPVFGYNPGRADKVARAHQSAPLLETDCFYVMESRVEPGKPISWAKPFLDNLDQFPNVEHDEYTDTFTQAAIYLRDTGWLDLEYCEPEEEEDVEPKAPKENPYAI